MFYKHKIKVLVIEKHIFIRFLEDKMKFLIKNYHLIHIKLQLHLEMQFKIGI